MTYLRSSILATIVYYDVFDYPLTLIELYKYLVNPGRISRITEGLGEIDLNEVAEELDKLSNPRIINQKNGFYFLSGRENLYDVRMRRDKISAQKWRKFLTMAKFLALAPYLRGVFASGSMAINNTEEKSDFDVLIVTKAGRLYTCRLFLWAITSLLRSRRKRNQKVAPNKFCFNHYITDNSLYLAHESLFNAQTYINLKPVMIKPELVDRFYAANVWLNNYAYNFRIQKHFSRRSIFPLRLFIVLAKAVEFVLNYFLGDIIEKVLKRMQQSRIKKNPVTYEPGGRVIFTEQELEFHPQSFESIVIEKYNRGLERLGIIPYVKEIDSGLIPLEVA